MMVVVLLGLLLAQPQERAAQLAVPERQQAEDLARAGRNAEALALFARLVEINPDDGEARFWVGMLNLRLGRPAEAESAFRAVLERHPDDIDAQIGLGMSVNRQGSWREALTILKQVEPRAGDNADLLAAIGRAYRRGGDFERAYDYFRRARTLAPDNWDTTLGYETAARAYSHWVGFEGYGQWGAPGLDVGAERIAGDVRVAPQLHLQAGLRLQQGEDYSDVLGGGGVVWRFARATNLTVQALGGSHNTTLPNRDISAEVVHYVGPIEAGGGVRQLAFADADVTAVSSVFAWETERWRFDTRYTYSRSSFHATDTSSGDHSVLVRATARMWRRTALQAAYAYGIESFEDLTADRLGSLGSSTVAAGLRFNARSLTRVTTIWEHQWRSNDTELDRITVSLVQYIP
jgi:tetratricopeptide (TPR) repeat protein